MVDETVPQLSGFLLWEVWMTTTLLQPSNCLIPRSANTDWCPACARAQQWRYRQCPCLTEFTSWWTRGKQQSHTHFNRMTCIWGRKGVNGAEIQWVNTTLERWGWHLIETWGPRMSPPQKEQGQRIPGRGNSKHKSLEAGKAQCFSFWEGRPDCLKEPLCAGCQREDVRHVWPKHAGPSGCLDFIPRQWLANFFCKGVDIKYSAFVRFFF